MKVAAAIGGAAAAAAASKQSWPPATKFIVCMYLRV